MAPASDDERKAVTAADDDEAAAIAAAAAATRETLARATSAGTASAESGASSTGGGATTEDEEEDAESNDGDAESNEEDQSSNNQEEDEEDDEDDDNDEEDEAEPMEVEAVPTDDDDEDDNQDGDSEPKPTTPAAIGKDQEPSREDQQQEEEKASKHIPPKMRIKLSLKAKAAAAAAAATAASSPVAKATMTDVSVPTVAAQAKKPKPAAADADEDVVMAEAHDGNDDNGEEVIATAVVIEEGPAESSKKKDTKPASASPSPSIHALHKPAKERAPPPSLSRPQSKNPQLAYTSTSGQGGGYHTRAMRLPSILSPGMLAVPNSSNNVGTAVCQTEAYKMLHGQTKSGNNNSSSNSNSNDDPYANYITSDSVFTYYMAAQGYNDESRSANPHRGSSLRRTVGDMFDNDVMSSINFPQLLPDYLRKRRKGGPVKKMVEGEGKGESKGEEKQGEAKGEGEKKPEDKDIGATGSPAKVAEATTLVMAVADSTKSKAPGKDAAFATPSQEKPAPTADEAAPSSQMPKKDDGKKSPKKNDKSPAAKVQVHAIDVLKSTLTSVLQKRKAADDAKNGSSATAATAAKRFRPLQFEDMVPISLTYPYPEEYTKARIEYAQKVTEREGAIAQDQVASQSAADIMDKYNRDRTRWQERMVQWEKDRAERKSKAAASAEAEPTMTNVDAGPSAAALAPAADQAETAAKAENGRKKDEDSAPNKDTPSALDSATGDATKKDEKSAEGQVKEIPKPVSPPPPEEPVLPPLPAPVTIPPIPVSPSPPSWDDGTADGKAVGIQHLSPETLKRYAANLGHLDPATYLSTVPTPRARYVGLSSNSFADTNFVGPAAHGIAGIGLGLGSGLSTAYTGASGGQGGGGLHSSSYYEGLKRFADHMGYSDVKKASPGKKRGSNSDSPGKDADKEENKKDGKPKMPKIKLKMSPPPPKLTSEGVSSSELKKMMESGGSEAEAMRDTIIKATVYAARMGKAAGDNFVGSDGKIYDGVNRAFSNFGGIKPCERCRKSKQGTFMCRIKRKHKEEDFDGGQSFAVLQEYFRADLNTLIRKPPSK